jgi:hypothetical protein
MGSDSGTSGDKTKQMLWIIPGSLLVLLVGYTLYTGQTIEEIGLGSLGSVKFAKPGNTPPPPAGDGHGTTPIVHPDAAKQVDQEETARRQADLEAKLRHVEEALKRSEARPVRRAQDDDANHGSAVVPRPVNIAGTWHDRTGVSWVIQQTGNAVAVREFNPILGVTAVGQDSISGYQLQLTYQSAMQTNGQASLMISPDGRNLSGNARDNVTGASFQLMFTP